MLIKRRLPINIITLVSIPLITLGITIYAYLNNTLQEESKKSMESLTSAQTNHLTNIIESETLQTIVMSNQESLINLLELRNKDPYGEFDKLNGWKEAKSYLVSSAKEATLVHDYYVIDKSGIIILDAEKERNAEGISIRNDGYFQDLFNDSDPITGVFEPRGGFGNTVVIRQPITGSKREVLGVLVKTLDLNALTRKILGTKLGRNGYFYLVDSKGLVIAHPEVEKIGNMSENEEILKILKDFSKIDMNKVNIGTYNYNGSEKFMAYKVIPLLNWVVIASQEMYEVKEPAVVTFAIIVAATLLLLVIAIFISLKISKSITKPIELLMNTMDRATDGDLGVKCELTTRDELGNLSNSFNIMIDRLSLSYQEQTALYEQLSAAEEELRAQYDELQSSQEVLRKNSEKLEYVAYYDSLTQLPNRNSFMDKLEYQLMEAKEKGNRCAVIFIDLDNFKNINDTLGHDYGDMLIREIANRLIHIKAEEDIIYRFGGDEFAILRTTEQSSSEVKEFSKKILSIINESYNLGGRYIYISGSIGVAMYPDDGDSTKVLLKNADTAMYRAKELGKNRYELFDSSMYSVLERKLQVEEILRRAITENGFKLLYQPQYDIVTKKIVGFEALLRIDHEKYGFISPAEFIPIAEENGLIVPIGEWVLREACTKDAQWRRQGYSYSTISVNISSVQLQHPEFIGTVKNIIGETGISPEHLELEITESILMESIDYSVSMLKQLRGMGIKLALDDFGTGYSSLNYLKKLPITTLKMDKSFIDEISISNKEEVVAKSIIDMAHTMELHVVAEGVELPEQLSILAKQCCDRVQGYLFSKPLAENMIGSLFQV